MVNAKKITQFRENIFKYLILLYLLIFPLGQLIRLEINLFNEELALHPTDLLAVLSLSYVIFFQLRANKLYSYIFNFLLAALFSLVLSIYIFPLKSVMVGGLYFIRLISYFSLFILTWNLVEKRKFTRDNLFKLLILTSFIVGILGWVQYFVFPDLRILRYLGWDDHMYRLVGSFLDPTFTAIILVFGFLAVYVKYLFSRRKKLLLILAFFLITVMLTYARASYLALGAGISITLLISSSKISRIANRKFVVLIIICIFFLIPLLPRPSSSGVELMRVYSIKAKVINYFQTYEIIKKYPLFGVGFNNMCSARVLFNYDIGYQSHSCSGSDSSLLLVLATTGIVGLIVFLNLGLFIVRNLKRDLYGLTFLSCLVALLVHSLFVNSLFYPWVMGWMGIMLAISIKSKSK